MYEQWHPLGVVGIITAFNFPMAVWSWNTAIAAVCGDPVLWKPSTDTPLTAIAVQHVANRVMADHGLSGIFTLTVGSGRSVGELLLNDPRAALVLVHGFHPCRKTRFRSRRQTFRRHDPRARRQQRRHRRPRRGSRHGDARYSLRGRGNCRTALHEHASHHRPEGHQSAARGPLGQSLSASPHRRPARRKHSDGTSRQRQSRRRYVRRPSNSERARRRDPRGRQQAGPKRDRISSSRRS